tara:strand:+ start:793 stop:1515 length:723 start_codon:yes stop_codon:yes gene_type:complete
MIDEDLKQRIKVGGIFLLQVYKIMTGTMLSLFIPQSCGDKMCSLNDNYNNSEVYHKMTFYWNSFSAFLFLCCYSIELYREEWCVKYLDIDNDIPDNSLKHIIVQEKELDKKMDQLNKYYYHTLCVNSFVYFVNILLTIHMINTSYYNNSTLSCFVSFVLLVLMKLYNSFTVAHQSVKNDKMMSAFMCEFVSFNVLDNDYVKEKYNGKKNNRLEDITDIEEDVVENTVREEEIIPIIEKEN